MSDPTFVGATVNTAEAPDDDTLAFVPPGVLDGDFLLLQVCKHGTDPAPVPDGWDRIGSDDGHTYYQRFADSEPADYLIVYNPGTPRRAVLIMAAYRHIDPDSPIADFRYGNGGPSDTPSCPALVIGTGTYMLVAGIEMNRGDETFTAPSGYSIAEQGSNSGTDNAHSSAAQAYKLLSGSSSAPAVQFGASAEELYASAHFALRGEDAPATEPIGWDIFAANDLLGDPLLTLEEAKGRWIRSELHGLGEGGFAINRHAAEVDEAIFAEGNMVKVRIPDCGPDYIDGFFIPGEGDYTLLSGQGGQGREDLVYRGPGALSYLDRARMTPCAFSIPPDIVGTWDKVWTSKAIAQPGGAAFDPDEPGFVYVGGVTSRKIKKLDQSTREVVSSSPALWSGTNRYLGGISFDPDDDSIVWALVIPWLAGSSANTQIKKVRRSDWEVLDTFDLGDDVKLTDIRVDGDFIWTSRYDNDVIQQRSKTTGNVVDSSTITYKGKVQRKPNGIAINGTKIAYWFGGDGGGGTGRALIADTSDPWNITDVQRTNGIEGFGGEWTTEGGEDFLYVVSYTAGKTWKYQLTDSIPACADDSGVFHPEQVAPGALAWRVLIEITHADRPVQPCPDLSFDFTEDEDSNGTPWPARTSTEEFTWRVGDRAFSDVLSRLIPAGVTFDLDVNTMTLHAYVDADFGTDRTSGTFGADKVRFVEGTNLAINGDLGRRDNRGQPDTYITVLGDGGVYGDATLAGPYVREGFMQVSGPTTGAVLDAIGDDELARQRLVSDALGFETLWGDAADPDASALIGRYIPKAHYWKGDLVRVDMAAGEFTYQEEDLRVYGTLITERDGGWRSALDLGSAYKVPPPIDSVPGDGGAGDGGGGGGKRSGTTVITSIPLTFTDEDAGVSIPRVTRVEVEGVTSPEPGVVVLPSAVAAGDTPLLEELLTDETDTRKHAAPDGLGGVTLAGPGEPITDHDMGAAETIDMAAGFSHRGTLTADCAISVVGYTVDDFAVAVLKITSDGTHAITWDSDVVSIGDDQAGNGVTWFVLFTDEGDGTIYLGKLGGGGSGGTPATTVEAETVFGLTPAVGTADEYARGDHTHGTPSVADLAALGFVGPVVIASVHSSPLVFEDLVQDSEGNELVYPSLP